DSPREDESRGNRSKQKRLVAYLTPNLSSNPQATAQMAAVSVGALRQWLQTQLPDYMIPAGFVWLEKMPLTPNGKIDRRALPAPDVETVAVEKSFTAPRSPLEHTLAAIWSQVLGVSAVGIDDNFFELGGDSILSLQVVAQAHQSDLNLTPRHLFEYQTIRALAAMAEGVPRLRVEPESDLPIAGFEQATLERLVSSQPQIVDAYPLSPSQQGMLFHALYSPEDSLYLNQMCCRLDGPLDVKALQQTWQGVCDHHPIFRTAFVWEDLPQPLQAVHRQVTLPWHQQDWRSDSPKTQETKLADLLRCDRTSGFQLSAAPLMRLTLVQLADESHAVIWSFHHAILDGWSLPLVFREVFARYESLIQDKPPRLAASRPYRDYIAWLSIQDAAAAEAFWTPLLRGFRLPTPLGYTKPADLSHHHEIQTLSLSPVVTAALQAFVQQSHLTLNTLVQGAWALLLSHISGNSDVLFGATTAGRPPGLARSDSMIGLFINSLPVRIQLLPDADIITWLQALQLQQSQARQYEYVALSQIQRWSEIPAGHPLFESLVVFENYPIETALDTVQSRLELHSAQSFINNSYPLTIRALPGRAALVLQIMSDRACFSAETTDRWLRQLGALLQWLAEHADNTVDQGQTYLTTLNQQWRQQQAQTSTQISLQKLRNIRRKPICSSPQEEIS
ncbi:MAG: condensation domain-containing protein, partial [Cyanobacteria bacterium P01_G01_bin.38]